MVLNQYIAELKKIKLLDLPAETALWAEYKERGNLEARQSLIEQYQPLVFKVVHKLNPAETVLLDVIQEGTVGLIEAVGNFDHSRGVAFSLYAIHRIKGRILNYLQREGKLRCIYIDSPVNAYDTNTTLADILPDLSTEVAVQIEQSYLCEQVKAAMGRLPLKEQLVLNGMYVDEVDPRQLAERLNVSATHVYRLQKQGIRRIRGMLSKLLQYW